MKKLAIVLLVSFCFTTGYAQLAFGIKAGANISNVAGSDASGTSSLLGFNAGEFLKIPILFKYSVAGVYVESGPQAGILMTAKAKALGETADDKNTFYAADWAWVFGAGVKIPMTPISVDARYNLGMANIINETENNGNTLNGSFQIGVMINLFTAPVR